MSAENALSAFAAANAEIGRPFLSPLYSINFSIK